MKFSVIYSPVFKQSTSSLIIHKRSHRRRRRAQQRKESSSLITPTWRRYHLRTRRSIVYIDANGEIDTLLPKKTFWCLYYLKSPRPDDPWFKKV